MSLSVKNARVLLVDDHPDVLRQVEALLSGEFEIVGVLADGTNLRAEIARSQPDLLVLDITLPWTSGIKLARELSAGMAVPRIVFLTVHDDADFVREAFAAGGFGYVVKSRLASDLIPALRAVLDGRRFLSAGVALETAV